MEPKQIVAIYQSPLTEEEYEGEAELLSQVRWISTYQGRSYEKWIVRFVGEERTVQRTVLLPQFSKKESV